MGAKEQISSVLRWRVRATGFGNSELLELGEDHDGADGEHVEEHDGTGGAQESGGVPEDAEQQAVEGELRVHEDLGDGVGGGFRNAELRLVSQHGERRDEAEAEEASGTEQRSNLGIVNGEVRGDDAGEDKRPDDAPGEGSSASSSFAGRCSLPGECFCSGCHGLRIAARIGEMSFDRVPGILMVNEF